MTWSLVFQLAVLIGSLGATGGGLTVFMSRNKIRSDATSINTDTSIHQVQSMRTELDENRKEIREFRKALYAHQRWDYTVIKKLEALGVTDIPEPPELWV